MRARLEYATKSFLVVAFLGSVTAGVLRLQQKALADERHHVDLGTWSVVERPPWCTDGDVCAIRDMAQLRGWRTSLLHRAAGPVLWRSMECAPLVARVVLVQKRFPDAFDAVLEIRRPVAAVRVGTAGALRWVEVDAAGVALSPPLASRPVRDDRPLRVVTGAAGAVPPPGGNFGPDVAEAADLSAELDRFGTPEDQELLRTLDEIDVANFGAHGKAGESEIVLRPGTVAAPGARAPAHLDSHGADARATRRSGSGPPSCAVEWGRARRADPYDPEPLFGEKASRLIEALRLFPALSGLRTVKVAFDDLVVVPAPGSPLARK